MSLADWFELPLAGQAEQQEEGIAVTMLLHAYVQSTAAPLNCALTWVPAYLASMLI